MQDDYEQNLLTVYGGLAPAYEAHNRFLSACHCQTGSGNCRLTASNISTEYANGVLTLHLPKAEALKPRKISVKKN